MKHVMIWLIRLYKKYISPLKPPCCRFTPTCSAYAIEAFQKRGFFAGFILTVWRILRCNPFGRGGYDPVPDKGFRSYSKCRETECEITTENEKEN
ncbi:MAG: membrane protein insertion efficiency factor YidD [Clostridia bacterium]|nr:membrane protein insertion efficiency factor YidD [Clostridia bacterium]